MSPFNQIWGDAKKHYNVSYRSRVIRGQAWEAKGLSSRTNVTCFGPQFPHMELAWPWLTSRSFPGLMEAGQRVLQADGDHWGKVGAHTGPEEARGAGGREECGGGEIGAIGGSGLGVCLGSSHICQVVMGKFPLQELAWGLCPSSGLLGGALTLMPMSGCDCLVSSFPPY